MIRVCTRCSNIDLKHLKDFCEDELMTGCIGECGENKGKSFGYIGKDLIVKDSYDEFFTEVKNYFGE